MDTKICTRCGERPSRETHDWCQPCITEYVREWRQKRANGAAANEMARVEAAATIKGLRQLLAKLDGADTLLARQVLREFSEGLLDDLETSLRLT